VLRYQDLKFSASKVLGFLHREPFFFWLADQAAPDDLLQGIR
jgi:hypothetical protein